VDSKVNTVANQTENNAKHYAQKLVNNLIITHDKIANGAVTQDKL
jgi:hypothetical protein